jgi:hemerythrin
MGNLFTDDLLTGNELLDSQHVEIFRRAEELFLFEPGERADAVYEAADFLRTYVLFHFEREEELMRRTGYRQSEEHIAVHRLLRKHVEGICLDLEIEGYTEELFQRMRELFAERFVKHIRVMDKAFVEAVGQAE